MQRFIVMLTAAVLLCACTTIKNTDEPMEESEARTGSNIARKGQSDKVENPVTVISKDAVDNLQRSSMIRNPELRTGR